MSIPKEKIISQVDALRNAGFNDAADMLSALVDEREKLLDELGEYDKIDHGSIWVAVGEYTHTDHKKLWKILTIPCSKVSAERYAEMANDEELKKCPNRRKHHFVVKLEKFDDY